MSRKAKPDYRCFEEDCENLKSPIRRNVENVFQLWAPKLSFHEQRE